VNPSVAPTNPSVDATWMVVAAHRYPGFAAVSVASTQDLAVSLTVLATSFWRVGSQRSLLLKPLKRSLRQDQGPSEFHESVDQQC
jgi:hypothetical protein